MPDQTPLRQTTEITVAWVTILPLLAAVLLIYLANTPGRFSTAGQDIQWCPVLEAIDDSAKGIHHPRRT